MRQFPVDDDAPRRARRVDRGRIFGEDPIDIGERGGELGPAVGISERSEGRSGLLGEATVPATTMAKTKRSTLRMRRIANADV